METFIARIDNYMLNILDISDTTAHALVRYEFVNTNGAMIDNMGRRPHEIKFRAFFFGSKYQSTQLEDPTYLNHFTFLEFIADSSKSHTLVHPKYGEIIGYVESYTQTHDDTQDYVTIDITFVEKDIQGQGIGLQISLAVDLQSQIDLIKYDMDKINNELTSGGFQALIGVPLDFSRRLSDQFISVTAPARTFLKDCDIFLDQCDTFLSNITAPVNSINNAVSFINDVPSRLLGSMNSACDRVVSSLSNLANMPNQFIQNMGLNLLNFYDTIGVTGTNLPFFQSHFLKIAAGSMAIQTGVLLQADESNRSLAMIQEKRKAFDAAGNRVNKVAIPVIMSAPQIDAVLFSTRDMIQRALVLDRFNQNLKNLAVSLIDYVNNIKLKKQSQVTMTVSSIPLHLLCMQLGIPYNAANRIALLNPGIINPTFTEGQIQTYVS